MDSWRNGAIAVSGATVPMGSAFPMGAAVAVILAGVLHATWNAMAKGTADRHASFALFGLSYAVCGAVAVAFVHVGTCKGIGLARGYRGLPPRRQGAQAL